MPFAVSPQSLSTSISNMSKRSLFFVIALCGGFLLAVNLLMVPWSRRLPRSIKLESIQRAKSSDLLFIGNSLLDGKVDVVALNQGSASSGVSFRPLNAALGGSDAYTQALLMRYAVRNQSDLKTLVVGFLDFQLTQNRPITPMQLSGNDLVAVDRRIPVSDVSEVYGFNSLQTAELRLLRSAPMLTNRENAWKYVELLRRSMGQVGMPPEAKNGMGRVSDFAALESGSSEAFDAEAGLFSRDPSHFNPSYERVFSLAVQRRMRVVVVLMPMPPRHRSLFYSRPSWREYFDKVKSLARQRGFTVIDASEWLPQDSQFADTLHMSDPGATEFSRRLGTELAKNVP
jgi:hypothetical protein